MKINFFLLAVFLSLTAFSQEEVLLKGIIEADSLQQSSIHIINTTQRTGTVNNSSGEFQITVKENDTLLFSSIQFRKTEIIITPEILRNKFLKVQLTEDVNELPIVNLSNIALTGNLDTDVGNMEVVKGLPLNLNFGDIKNLRFEADINDPQSIPENLAFQQNQIIKPGGAGASVNLLAVAGVISNILGLKKETAKPAFKGKLVSNKDQLRLLFDDNFFKSTLGIKEDSIEDFLHYVNENGLEAQMLRKENGLALMEFLLEKSKSYQTFRKGQ